MAEKKRMDFCTTCRKDTTYTLEKININKIIKDKEYNFSITAALCDECGEAMAVPGLIDKNIQEIDEQYRAYENLVSIDEIENGIWRGYHYEIPFRTNSFQRIL